NTRTRRVLPSRGHCSRIGNCDVDAMIFEAQRENVRQKPCIPADSCFVLKTDPTLEQATAANSILVTHQYECCFDRPEVMKAYKEQSIIETPDCTRISAKASLNNLNRPCAEVEDVHLFITSDAAYIERHREFERTEKEEHLSNLQSRVAELRGMDIFEFINAPASLFSPPPDVNDTNMEDPTSNSREDFHRLEGERRREEMIMSAQEMMDR
ncbi:hypothetical protein R3P38DRAFT_3567311, partial [Favolaschia claudopus]